LDDYELLVEWSGRVKPPAFRFGGSDEQTILPVAATSVTDMFPALGGNENLGDLDRSDPVDNCGRL
jgi:hypothetical protein